MGSGNNRLRCPAFLISNFKAPFVGEYVTLVTITSYYTPSSLSSSEFPALAADNSERQSSVASLNYRSDSEIILYPRSLYYDCCSYCTCSSQDRRGTDRADQAITGTCDEETLSTFGETYFNPLEDYLAWEVVSTKEKCSNIEQWLSNLPPSFPSS